MKVFCNLVLSVAFTIVFFGSTSVLAQNMSDTVVTKEVKFAKGESSATVRGSAKYAMSYVYTIGAKKGQTMELKLSGKNSKLAFSLTPPEGSKVPENWEPFAVTKWSGELPATGKYEVVIVMNDENGGSVPFTLDVKIK